ncbi:UDP-glucosyltransferase 2-like [Homalodisca vitripennis]|uniref:UDP-glucosyltransferase 2-like n=1 Tax=Homalodisca vitripennis TaxID=197043 RepID=UPI001EEC8C81|nr:UDP-glucosyltransferase 2-like [Homalodisca vitripennis]
MVRTLVLLGLLYGICHGSRILVFYPGPSTSLLPSFSQLFQELARRGHQLTVVTAYKLRGLEDQNIKQLLMDHSTSHDEMKNIVDLPLLPHINFLWQMALTDCESLFQSVKFKEFLRANETYDLFIGSPFYFLECSIAVAHHLNLPVLNIYSNQLQIHATHLMGHDFPSSYVAGYDLHFSHKMNFWERSLNSIFCLGYSIGLSMYYVPRMNGIVREHFPHLPPLQEMLPQISVTLLNTNLAVHPSQPRFPGIIPVAGLTIPQKLKLPKELEQWMDKSENGVILFNVGSNINMTSLAPEVLEVILGVFDSLPQRVLMKWEGDELVGKPANVRIIKCIPQAAVLAHPKCRMMITHGGLHSWMEAVHYSVPLLGILPSFLDQFHNLVEMQERGHGIYFKGPWTQNNFHSAINEVLHNYKYRERIQQASKIFWDQPLNPLQTAVFWTEYVIRHNGSKHLLSPAFTLPWYQAALLDVVGFLLLSVLALVLLFRAALRAFKRWLLDYEYIIFNKFLRICYKLKGN